MVRWAYHMNFQVFDKSAPGSYRFIIHKSCFLCELVDLPPVNTRVEAKPLLRQEYPKKKLCNQAHKVDTHNHVSLAHMQHLDRLLVPPTSFFRLVSFGFRQSVSVC